MVSYSIRRITSALLVLDRTQKGFINIERISGFLWMNTQITITELLVQRVIRIWARVIRVIRIKGFNELLNIIQFPFSCTHLRKMITAPTKCTISGIPG